MVSLLNSCALSKASPHRSQSSRSPPTSAVPATLERAVEAFARKPNGGLMAVPGLAATTHRALIFQRALRHGMPSVFPFRHFAVDGGLASYGPDQVDQYRR